MTQHAVVCDVNETMLDLRALDPLFTAWFGEPSARTDWFTQTLHFAMTLAATRTYRNFGEVGAAALAAVAQRRGRVLPGDATAQLRAAMLSLPPHPDVAPGLRLLREAGFVTATLSNNPLPTVRAQMEQAGLTSILDDVMSVEQAGTLKPAPEVYRFALARLALPPAATWMVAAHGWDIAGAMRCGMRGAFVARPGQRPDPFVAPTIVASDLLDAASQIIATQDII
jgi:2-haloacid dehalogenase